MTKDDADLCCPKEGTTMVMMLMMTKDDVDLCYSKEGAMMVVMVMMMIMTLMMMVMWIVDLSYSKEGTTTMMMMMVMIVMMLTTDAEYLYYSKEEATLAQTVQPPYTWQEPRRSPFVCKKS